MKPSQKCFLDGLAKGQQYDPEGCQGDCRQQHARGQVARGPD